MLRKMEGAVLDTCPGQAVSGDRGQLVVEDRSKRAPLDLIHEKVSEPGSELRHLLQLYPAGRSAERIRTDTGAVRWGICAGLPAGSGDDPDERQGGAHL